VFINTSPNIMTRARRRSHMRNEALGRMSKGGLRTDTVQSPGTFQFVQRVGRVLCGAQFELFPKQNAMMQLRTVF
jgi:hypothetical protein